MKQRIPLPILILAAIALGLSMAWVDSRPGWDDTAVTVFALLLLSAAFSFLKPQYALLWALLIGAWIPLIEIISSGIYASLIALFVTFLGALLGAFAHKLLPAKASASV